MSTKSVELSKFKFVNGLDRDLYAAVHHLGCAGVPWRGGLPMCWSQDIGKGEDDSYTPSDWVTKFTTWAELIGAGAGAAIAIAVTAGTAAPEAAAAVAEVAGDVELADLAADSSVELTTVAQDSLTAKVMKILGAKAIGVATGAVLSQLLDGWGVYVRPQDWADVREPVQAYIHKGELIVAVPDLPTIEDARYFKKA